MKAPIALFVFNRPDHTRKTLEALVRNHGASEHVLHVFCDGPRNEQDAARVQQVRDLCRNFPGFAAVQMHEQAQNRGLANSLISGITQILQEHETIIVLEDDLVTSPAFLEFMNAGLEKYRNDQSVASIHGYVYPIENLPESFFIRGADCWGWATWRRAWAHFEKDSAKLLQALTERNLLSDFDFGGSYPYVQMLKNQMSGKVNSWAIRWLASAYLKNMVTLYPGKTLVDNIGFDNSGTHTDADRRFYSELATTPPKSWPDTSSERPQDRARFQKYLLSLKPWHQRLAWKLTRLSSLRSHP